MQVLADQAAQRRAAWLLSRTGRSVPAPRAVAVLWAPFPQQHAVSRSVDYVAGDHIADWLLGQPRQLHHEHVAQLVAVAHTQMLADQRRPPAAAAVRA